MIMSILSDLYDGAVDFVSSISTGQGAAQQTAKNPSTAQGIAGLMGAAMEMAQPFVQESVSRPSMPSNMTNVPDSVKNDPRVQNLLGSYGFPNDMPEYKSQSNFERNFPSLYGALSKSVSSNGMDPTFDPKQLYGNDYSNVLNISNAEQSRMLYDQSGILEFPTNDNYLFGSSLAGREFSPELANKLELYADSFAKSAKEYDLEPSMLQALVLTESGGDPNAESSAGALGLTQIMPATGQALLKQRGQNLTIAETKEALKDPVTNISLSAQLIGQLTKQYNGDPEKVFAAYNAGPGRVNDGKYTKFKETATHYRTMRNMLTGLNRQAARSQGGY